MSRVVTSAPQSLDSLSTEVMSRAIEAMASPLVITDNTKKDNPIIYVNQAFCNLTGYNKAEMIGRNCRLLQGPSTDKATIRRIRLAVKKSQHSHEIIQNYRKDGTNFWNELVLSPMLSLDGTASHYLGIQQDVTERLNYVKDQARLQKVEQAADLLRKEKKQLVELNRAKDEFISLSSHQLRTPATSVKQYLGMILEGYSGKVPKHLEVFIKTAYESNDRQLTIINDLLRTAKLDSGRHFIKRKSYDIGQLVSEVVTEYQLIVTMRRQEVITEYDPNSVALVDPVELKIVLINLLENASKYSADGSTITINVHKKPKAITISVTDDGVGIRPQDHKRVFDKFTRVDNKLSDTVSGNGLGLYFVKRIIRLHGGKVRLESALGKGSTFAITLPV
jgi:PAS domain S-box-containing protein